LLPSHALLGLALGALFPTLHQRVNVRFNQGTVRRGKVPCALERGARKALAGALGRAKSHVVALAIGSRVSKDPVRVGARNSKKQAAAVGVLAIARALDFARCEKV